MPDPSPPRLEVLGVRVDALTRDQAVMAILELARRPGGPSVYVVKPYVEFLERAARDGTVRDLLNGAWLVLADGVGAQWAAYYRYGGRRSPGRLIGSLLDIMFHPHRLDTVLPQRFAGITFTRKLLEAARDQDVRVYLVGSPRGSTIAETARVLSQLVPGLHVVGTHDGRAPGLPAGRVDAAWYASLLEDLSRTEPDLILIGMSFPLQEQVMATIQPSLPHGVMIGEGGSFDYRQFGGMVRRAPRPLRAVGLEWLWRLLREPRRIRRQAAIPRFIWHVWRSSSEGQVPTNT
jgi:N-acetylglucosaminyldiphosphoundecaprenol N-acetyl-beta-D-mannosaminyltransferase